MVGREESPNLVCQAPCSRHLCVTIATRGDADEIDAVATVHLLQRFQGSENRQIKPVGAGTLTPNDPGDHHINTARPARSYPYQIPALSADAVAHPLTHQDS